MKNKLLDWVDEQFELDPTSKLILLKLALYADAENVAWAAVATLAKQCNVSERTVQTRMRALEKGGYIEATGGFHTTSGKHPREIPLYRLAPRDLGAEEAEIWGANPAPQTNLGCKPEQSGVQLFAPLKEPIEPTSGANAPSERVREREAQFVALEAAVPQAMLGSTDRHKAWRVFNRLADEGLDLEKLVEAARRLAADPKTRKRDFAMVGLDRWLDQGRYRGHWPTQDAQAGAPPGAFAAPAGPRAGGVDQAAWTQVSERLKTLLGAGLHGSWIGPAYLGDDGQGPVLVTATGTARDWITANAWERAKALWADAAPAGRTLRLMAKREFEGAR